MDDFSAWIAFSQLQCLSLSQKHLLLNRFKTVQAIFDFDLHALNLKIKPSKNSFCDYIDHQTLDQTLIWLNQSPDRHIIHLNHDDYPTLLTQIGSAPLMLCLIGNPKLLANKQIAIVGARKSTIAGKQTAEQFAGELAMCGLTVTSGMALGIDCAAHRGTLAHYGNTIAVLGTGVDHCYPKSNKDLYHQISEQGLLVSEFALGSPPKKEHFPRRNRIISGLSLGVLVVEAAQRSGSLITANYAIQQNREVFAVPGSIHSKTSSGCLGLIQQGAKLTRCTQDILEEFSEFSGSSLNNSANVSGANHQSISTEDGKILQFITHSPVSFDKLITQSGLTIDQLCSMLLDLELYGMIEKLPGNQFIRTAK